MPNLTKIEGVFATCDMQTGEILHICEMLNADCTEYKRLAMKRLVDYTLVGTACHDCACQRSAFEGTYCDKVLLDGLKYKTHKCSAAKFHPFHKNNVRRMHGLNSQVVEQLWSKTNKLAPIAVNLRRDSVRMFIRAYCIWRNSYIRSGYISDTNPSISAQHVNNILQKSKTVRPKAGRAKGGVKQMAMKAKAAKR